jgi:HEAT repeat protein
MYRFCRAGLPSRLPRNEAHLVRSIGCPLHVIVGACLLLAALLSGCSASKPENAPVSNRAEFAEQELLSRLPARDAVESRLVSASFLQEAPRSVLNLCVQLDTLKPGSDAKVRYALSGLTDFATLPGHGTDKTTYARALCTALGMMHTPLARAFVMEQLQLAGGTESVQTLCRFLTDETLCEPAVQALLAIRTPDAVAGMREALRQTDGTRRITLVNALGELHDRDIVPGLIAWTQGDDHPLRDASLAALAAIGDPRSADRIRHPSLQLTYARSLAENGNRALAEKTCRALLSAPADPAVKAAALSQLAGLLGDRAMDDLVTAACDSNRDLRASALALGSAIRGQGVTERWISTMVQTGGEARAGIVQMLGQRNDPAALPAVIRALGDTDPAVRIAAVKASAKLGGADALEGILGILTRTERADEIAAVYDVLVPLPLKTSVPAATETLESATPAAKVMLLQFLGSCGRLVPSSAIIPLARSESAPVRLAAMKTLESVAEPGDMGQLVQLLLAARTDAEANGIRRTIVAVASRNPSPELQADFLLTALDTASAGNEVALIRTIGRVGGRKSLAVLSRGIASKDPAIRDASVRALADSPDEEAFDSLLVVARGKQPLNYKVLALRGCLRIVDDGGYSADRSAHMLEQVIAASTRPEEKRLALASLGNTRSVEALRVASDYLADDSVGFDAALAVHKITASDEMKDQPDVATSDVVRVLVDKNASPYVRKKFKAYQDAHSQLNKPPEGFVALFNGKDLKGWKGLVADPPTRAKMTAEQLARAQAEADSSMRLHWSVQDGVLVFDGKGANLCTAKDYGDFEMLVDWKIEKHGDSGIYLRGSPQVQIWDPAQWPEGSGGLYNNQKGPSKPLRKADHPIGEWNTFRIRMVGDRVTVYLNDVLVVDSVTLENYWEREKPIYPTGAIELQSHSSPLYFRNIFIREIPRKPEPHTELLFNGKDLTGWELVGGSTPWGVKDGVLYTEGGGGGWISTVKEYGNFKLDLEFRVPQGGNSGVFLRTPREGDPAYVGMEIQVLDDYAPEYANLHSWQYTGSIYGVQAPSMRVSKKAGEWQHYVIVADGPHVTVTLNEQLIVDADLVSHMDLEKTHPGLKRRGGYIGLQNHSTRIEYRNIRITEF